MTDRDPRPILPERAGNSAKPLDPVEGASHPPASSPAIDEQLARELRPVVRQQRRHMVRELLRRMRRRGYERKTAGENRRRKRKTALAFSAVTMGIGSMAATAPTIATPASITAAVPVDASEFRVHAGTLKASETMKEALAEEEGVRLTVYRDVAGYPTVGVGHLVQPQDGLRVGDTISYEQALEFLEKDLLIAEEGVRKLVGDLPLYQHEFDALVDLVYNVGEGNVSERESPRLNVAITAQDYDAIADELHYYHAKGSKARGLIYRSERREAIFTRAAYDDPRPVGITLFG